MKKLLFPLLFVFTSLSLYSQKEANFWYFGHRAALDFNSGTPLPVANSELDTTEGCSSFSDADGNLLFYVGAPNPSAANLTVWNRNNEPMPFCDVANGGQLLNGDASSSQSALTVPAPGQPNIYFLFTVGAPSSGNQGFWYYTIDMSADGGNGDIIAGPVPLGDVANHSEWSEKVTAVRGEDCNTFWVISFLRPGTFYAYKVTDMGVDIDSPVISNIPGYIVNDGRGYLKVSPDGEKLVSANMTNDTFLFNFNDATGVVSNYDNAANPQRLNLLSPGVAADGYGVEFSLSSRRLYVSTGAFSNATEGLFQFDLTLPSFADINNQANINLIHSYNNSRGALQLGPDTKIYWTSNDSSRISVINNPEELGAAANYSHLSVDLGGVTASQGLPPFLSSLLLPIELTDSNTNQVINNQTIEYCLMDNIIIQPEPVTPQPGSTVSYEWSFNDGTTTSVLSNTTNLTVNNADFTDAGQYTLTVTLTDACGNPTTLEGLFDLVIYNNITATQPSDIYFCDSDGDATNNTFDLQTDVNPAILNGQDPATTSVVYFLSQADADDNVTANALANPYNPGVVPYNQTIYARVHNTAAPNACYATTSFLLNVSDFPVATMPNNMVVCDGDGTDPNDTDGFFSFDLESQNPQVLGTLPSAQYSVSYHTSLTGAQTSNSTDVILTPTAYQNVTAFTTETIYVRVQNNNNADCFDTTQFDITVNALPTVSDITVLQCDNDADLMTTVNLTLEQPSISTNHANETFEFYATEAEAIAGTPQIADPVMYPVNTTGQAWVRTISTEGCYRISRIDITISFAADVAYTRVFTACDDYLDINGNDNANNDDTDGITTFDFSDARTDILNFFPATIQPDLQVDFYETQSDRTAGVNALTNLSSHRNNNDPSYANVQTIYAKIVNTTNNDCTGLTQFTLQVTPVPVANTVPNLEQCDDAVDGDATNGFVQNFDLESQTPGILGGQDPAIYTVTYHSSPADAASGANALSSPFTNTVANQQTIYVRITGNGCYFDRYSFDVVVNSLPTATALNMANTLEVCDNDADGSATNGFVQDIDLEMLNTTILGTQDPANFTVTYHTSLALAQSGSTPITGPYTNTSNPGRVYVRIVNNTTMCVNDTFNFDIQVNPEPLANPDNTLSNLSLCDDDTDTDDTNGFVQSFDLESQIPDILGDPTVQDEDDFNVTFHLSQADATSGNDPQSSPFTNTVANQQTIYVRIENKATGCVNDDLTFEIIVNPLPDFVVTSPQIICLNNPPLTLQVENPNAVYTYQWNDPSGNPLGTDITQDVTVGGEYTVTATTTDGTMCSRTRTITVNESNIATIEESDVTIVDDSDNNSITINNDNNNLGEGDYEFSLVDGNGTTVRDYQDSNVFEGLEGGIYTILVRDKNGCGISSLDVAVIAFPKFFTPNGDSINDTWAVQGASSVFFPNSTIYIFNRQGKVMAEVPIDSEGWNGIYNNSPAPSNDYWFKVQLEDRNGNVRNRTGHFSLLRR